jgi:prevent-host-death family protein
MEISAKELRGKPAKIIEQASRGTEVIITVRGKKMARLIPYRSEKSDNTVEDKLFGLWKDEISIKDVDEHVRSIRKGRKF